MSGPPPISFRPGQQTPAQQYGSNMMAFINPNTGGGLPYGMQPQPGINSQPSHLGMPIPGQNPFAQFGQHQQNAPRQTFFNKSTAGMMPQNMSHQHVNQLKNVMPCLDREFKSTNYNVVIINNAQNPGSPNFDLTIDVEVMLKLGDNQFPLKVQVPKEFPNQAPTLFSKSGVSHQLINKMTQEINFSQYYPWDKKTSKTVDLVVATEKYFRLNNPFDQAEGKRFDACLESTEDAACKKISAIDVKGFYNKLSADNKKVVASGDQFKTFELLKASEEYKQAEQSKKLLGNCIGMLAQTVSQEMEKTNQVYSALKKAQIDAECSTSELNGLITSVAFEGQKFDKNNVVHSIEQRSKKIETDCLCESFSEQLKSTSDKSSFDKILADFIKKRTEYNKMVIVKGKLSGVQLIATRG